MADSIPPSQDKKQYSYLKKKSEILLEEYYLHVII